jgi:hypothetical protein
MRAIGDGRDEEVEGPPRRRVDDLGAELDPYVNQALHVLDRFGALARITARDLRRGRDEL